MTVTFTLCFIVVVVCRDLTFNVANIVKKVEISAFFCDFATSFIIVYELDCPFRSCLKDSIVSKSRILFLLFLPFLPDT